MNKATFANEEKKLFTEAERIEVQPFVDAYTAAELLNIPYQTLMRIIKRPDNEIPFIKVGSQYRFDVEGILKKARGIEL
ncbi:excisionase family DNA-binding protein [Atopococcus tabaci]|uniref:excisionase family DNA-binding protein n=1 Tax=Atopococcus tabaci TaxID=269774 RepID=UPI002409113D|nr:excisionase family DNA-binding protein [Atopococcus tabaci]